MRRTIRSPGATPDHVIGGVPCGCILDYAGATAPDGFLLCNGQAVSSVDYPALFAAIGILWGGDGLPNFNVPNFKDRMALGKGDITSVGNTGGDNGTHTHAQVAHAHTDNFTFLVENHTHGINSSLGTISLAHNHTWYFPGNPTFSPSSFNAAGNMTALTSRTEARLHIGMYDNTSVSALGTEDVYIYTNNALSNYDATHAHGGATTSSGTHYATKGGGVTSSGASTTGNSSINNLPLYGVVNKIIKT